MTVSVFYSWQSELPENINHYLIRDALKDATRQIKRDLHLDERPEVDHDTKNTPGSPDIAATIFSKIAAGSAFVADVSFTSKSDKGRLCANPNVLIELGFALSALGDKRLILVMNEAFGSPNGQMPFNLDGRRWPITFNLRDDADKEAIKVAQKKLSQSLTLALEAMAKDGVLFLPPRTTSAIHHDRTLFQKLLDAFSPKSSSLEYFLRDCDVASDISGKHWCEAQEFCREWGRVEYEFLTPNLNEKRTILLAKLNCFLRELGSNFNSRNPSGEEWGKEFYTMGAGPWDIEDPRWQKAEEINDMGTAAFKAYEDFVRDCKQYL